LHRSERKRSTQRNTNNTNNTNNNNNNTNRSDVNKINERRRGVVWCTRSGWRGQINTSARKALRYLSVAAARRRCARAYPSLNKTETSWQRLGDLGEHAW